MSFDISGPTPSRKPVIIEAQSMENNGSGGNLGYMQNRKKKKNQEDEFESSEIQFSEEEVESGDYFSFQGNTQEEEPKKSNKKIYGVPFLERIKKVKKGKK